MKKTIYIVLVLFAFVVKAQGFTENEYVKYRVHYGVLNAGFATLKMENAVINGRPQYHVVGKGSSSGAVRVFFKVDDRYETYIDKATYAPTKFIRKVKEGGYRKDIQLTFNHQTKRIYEKDFKNKKSTTYSYKVSQIQDMLSAFYYLRTFKPTDFKTGTSKKVYVFMSGELFPFKLKVMGRETVKTKFGKIKCIKMVPYVQEGRVFKAKESVTVWVSDDENLLPVKLQADLAVGSLKMSIYQYKNLKTPLTFKE